MSFSNTNEPKNNEKIRQIKKVAEVTKQFGDALNRKTTDFGKILGKLKEASTQAKLVFSDIKKPIEDKYIATFVLQAEKINKALEKDSVNGYTIKNIIEMLSSMKSSIIDIAKTTRFEMIAGGNEVSSQLKKSFSLMSPGVQHTKTFYLKVIEPNIDKFTIKIEMDNLDSHYGKAHYSDLGKEDILKTIMVKAMDLGSDKTKNDEDMIYVLEDPSELEMGFETEIPTSISIYEEHDYVVDTNSFWVELEAAIYAIEVDEPLSFDADKEELVGASLLDELGAA